MGLGLGWMLLSVRSSVECVVTPRGRRGVEAELEPKRERTRREVGQNPARRRRETSSGERNRESLD